MKLGCCQKNMQKRICGAFYRIPGIFDILPPRSGKRGYGRIFYFRCNGFHARKIAGRYDGKARFNDIHVQTLQLLCHSDFFLNAHAEARSLLPVAER